MKKIEFKNGTIIEFTENGEKDVQFKGVSDNYVWYIDTYYGLCRLSSTQPNTENPDLPEQET